MGYYLNVDSKGNALPAKGKAKILIADGAILTDETFKDNLICVVENELFEAAGYAYSEDEFKAFKETSRQKTWLIHPNAKDLAK